MKQIVLDTNFLLTPYQFKIDVFLQIEELVEEPHVLVTGSCVISELKKISEGKAKRSAAARFALKLIASKEIKIIESNMHADHWILSYAKANENIIVCTNDINLRKDLRKVRKKVIGLRTKSRLRFL